MCIYPQKIDTIERNHFGLVQIENRTRANQIRPFLNLLIWFESQISKEYYLIWFRFKGLLNLNNPKPNTINPIYIGIYITNSLVIFRIDSSFSFSSGICCFCFFYTFSLYINTNIYTKLVTLNIVLKIFVRFWEQP